MRGREGGSPQAMGADGMKVLVVGGGAREHALCWKLRQSPLLRDLFCAPGNPGISQLADLVPVAPEEIHSLADFAADLRVDLTIVGPELPLTLAIAKDYKRIGDGDTGPNTGGMGSHSPGGLPSGEAAAEIVETVMRTTVSGLAEEGRPFVGVL